MANAARVYLGSVAHELGERQDIAELEAFQKDPGKLEAFRKMGMEHYCHARVDAQELARASMAQTLQRSPLRAEQVDVVLYCSENVGITPESTQRFHRSLHDLGLVNAYPIGVTMSNSSNCSTLCRVAASLIRAGEARNILLVLADVAKSAAARVMEPALAVIADGAASCIVSSESEGEFELVGLTQAASHRAAVAQEGKKGNLEGFKMQLKACQRLLREHGLSAASFARVITNNYGLAVLESFSAITGVPLDRIYRDNVGRLGHVASADNLINLRGLQEAGGLERGSTLLMISSSQFSCGFAALRVCQAS
jgi:3-oxoacyl-[acyl-carrier-protein] synthase III